MSKIILTGDRPTGRLHLGHYVGSLKRRVELQNSGEFDKIFIMIADAQALTDNADNPEKVRQNIIEVALDYLSVGIDPAKTNIFIQSQISQLTELTFYYMNLVTVSRLQRNPTVKSEIQMRNFEASIPVGFFTYPISQAADITAFKATTVPVGEDQLPHMEVTRKLVRRFNEMYCPDEPILVEPKAMLSSCSRLMGLDGNAKMGKSLGNAIYLSDTAETVLAKVKTAVTDPSRISLKDPGHPEVCTVNKYHQIFNPTEHENICEMCKNASIGCVACKKNLAKTLNDLLDPFRERRSYYEAHHDKVKEIIENGTALANQIGNETCRKVKDAMHLKL